MISPQTQKKFQKRIIWDGAYTLYNITPEDRAV